MCAFSTSLTTTVFSQRSMWRFETVPHRTIPEGQQSSIFHRALIPPSDCLPTTRFLIRGAPDDVEQQADTTEDAQDREGDPVHHGVDIGVPGEGAAHAGDDAVIAAASQRSTRVRRPAGTDIR